MPASEYRTASLACVWSCLPTWTDDFDIAHAKVRGVEAVVERRDRGCGSAGGLEFVNRGDGPAAGLVTEIGDLAGDLAVALRRFAAQVQRVLGKQVILDGLHAG